MRLPTVAAFGLALCVVICATAPADDLLPPNWRGAPNSTLQIWEFSTGENPVGPEVDANEYGQPVATVYGEFNYPFIDTYWLQEDHGHLGVWNVGGSMALDIPNDPVLRPLKLIRLQVTYDSSPPPELSPWIDVIAADDAVVTDFQLVQRIALDDWYVHDTYDIVIEPNPSSETIWLQPRYCGVLIDQIVVDTVCVPEPSTLVALAGILGLGIVACVFRRRRRSR